MKIFFNDFKFRKNVIENEGGSFFLGHGEVTQNVTEVPIKGTDGTFTFRMVLKGLRLRVTRNGNFAFQFPETARVKDGVPVMKTDGTPQYDANEYLTPDKESRAAFKRVVASIPGVADAIAEVCAIIEARNTASGADAPAPEADASEGVAL
jgi:hypothetical protein